MLKREGAIRSSTEGKLEWKPIMLTEKKKFTNEPIGYRGRRRGVVEGIDISTESGRPYPLGYGRKSRAVRCCFGPTSQSPRTVRGDWSFVFMAEKKKVK